MIKILNKTNCSGCSACANICPKNCIKMQTDEEGFLYPRIDADICIECKLCEKVCPISNFDYCNENENCTAYAVINKNESIRLASSSGGVFSLIAENVINQQGVVIGAAFDDNFLVKHIIVDDVDGLAKLRGSKYVQSDTSDTFSKTKQFLDEGRIVLYSGTPCQIAGLLSFLNKPYENLVTLDLICHGAPSPAVWQKYVKFRSSLANSNVKKVSFRYKEHSLKSFSTAFVFDNCEHYICKFNHDPFMKVFLKDLCLRPSCYDCKFKSMHRKADITLADFWGIQNVLPEFDDDKGTSLVLINTKKGNQILKGIEENIIIKEVNVDDAIRYNSSAIQSVKQPKARKKFMATVNSSNFEKVARKYTKSTLKSKIKTVLFILKKRILGDRK